MTTNYHTPIPEGAAANAATFNDPLGQMDEALSEALLEERDGHIIQEEGTPVAQQPVLDFVGAGVAVTNEVGKTVVTIPGGVTDHGALDGLTDDDHPQYLLKSGLREWDEQGSDPATPASGKWKLYFKSDGLYLIDDAGIVLGPLGTGSGTGSMPVFNVLDYGAVSEYKYLADGAMTSGSAVLTSASNPFAAGDVGKKIAVVGAGAGGVILYSTISSYTNAGSVTLANANASGGNITGKAAEWGVDNTTAFQNCINAASAANGTMYVPTGQYMVGSLDLTDTTGWTLMGEGVNATRLYALPGTWNATTGHLLDLTGAHDMVIKSLQIGAYNMITRPATAIACLQTAANLANAVTLEDVYISGSYQKTTMYVYGVPSSSTLRCKFYNYIPSSAAEVLVYSGANAVYSLTSAFATVASGFYSTSDWTHFALELHKFGGNSTGAPLRLDVVADLRFYGGVISGGAASYILVSGACSNLMISGVTFETESEPTPTNVINTSGTITGFSFDQSTYVISGGEFLTGAGNIVGTTGSVGGYHFTSTIGATIAGGATSYFGLVGHDATENNTVFICERKGILTGLRAFSSASPGTGKTYTYMLRKDDGDSIITCSHSNANTSSTDLTHYIHVIPGTYITIKFSSTAAANATRAFANIQFIPTG